MKICLILKEWNKSKRNPDYLLKKWGENGVKIAKKNKLPTERSLPFTLGYRKSKLKKKKTFSSKASLNV